MQYGARVTLCAGFSSASPSSAPMKNLPPGIIAISAGHAAGADGDADAAGVAATGAAAGSARSGAPDADDAPPSRPPRCPPKSANAPPPTTSAPTATTARINGARLFCGDGGADGASKETFGRV